MTSRRASPAREAPSLAELEEALTGLAYIVLRHGEVYAPLMERLEREVEEAKRRAPSAVRARRILDRLETRSASIRPLPVPR